MEINLRKILSGVSKSIYEFKMIENGDKVAVGLSGGKDSLILLAALANFKKFKGQNFELLAITIDQTGGKADYSKLKQFCNELNVPLHIEKSDIFEIIFDVRKEANPCSLCAKLRRGILCSSAKKLGCNKLALAHHKDDLVETFFLSLFYEGRINTFSPVTYLSNSDITCIRPLIFVDEKDIILTSKNLPIFKNPCPIDRKTKREEIKNFLKNLYKNKNMEKQIKNAILNNLNKILNN
ncbi:MAG: tRNA 2-thiocytidine(32) synthetase TtcA [Clostridia bacterium]|nr:tRNA 2-thiocytidine(32) synthetase TtcA [Clostridia bacterium]